MLATGVVDKRGQSGCLAVEIGLVKDETGKPTGVQLVGYCGEFRLTGYHADYEKAALGCSESMTRFVRCVACLGYL